VQAGEGDDHGAAAPGADHVRTDAERVEARDQRLALDADGPHDASGMRCLPPVTDRRVVAVR
jgi:hypothetical protein